MSNIVLKDAIVFITGANRKRGIGRALVEEAIQRGAKKIYVTSRHISELNHLALQHPKIVVPLQLNVTQKNEIEKAVQAASDTQILINNSGFSGHAGICFNHDEYIARQEMEVNYFGMLYLIRAFCKVLMKNQNTAIVNVVSIGGLAAFPLEATYCASKAAAHSLTQSVRAELKPHGVSVFGVYPGPIDTDMADGMEFQKESSANAAIRILDGIEQGIEDITTDGFADEVVNMLRVDSKVIEKEWSDYVHHISESFLK